MDQKRKKVIVSTSILLLLVAIVVLILIPLKENNTEVVSSNSTKEKTVSQGDVSKDTTDNETNDSSVNNSETKKIEEIPDGMYQNPVFEPVLADPSIIRAESGYYYAYGTEDDWGDGHGAKVAPIIRSENLVDWEYVGEAFTEKPSWKEGWVWAPEVQRFNDKYYMYYTKSTWGDKNPGIGVAVADKPEGPFEDQGKLFDSAQVGVYSIDPMLVVENDTPYLFFGGITSGTFAIELTKDGLSTVGEKFTVISSGYEAPYIIKRDNFYYFFGSAGSCCNGANSSYRVDVGRSESLLGPYFNKEGQNMLHFQGSILLFGYIPVEEGKGHIVGPGHNAVISDDAGTDWIVYHGINADIPKLSSGATRRPLFIDKIEWVDGWPVIEGAIPSITPKKAPKINE
jgi:arabinan endo-1,5-alpha-L-arabinosidase